MSFFTQMVVGQYVPGDSVIHRLNPMVKVCLTLIMTVELFVFTRGVHYLVFGLALVLIFALTRLPPGFFLRGLRPILMLIGLTFLIHMFLTPSPTRVPLIGGISLPLEGLATGALFSGRLILLVGLTTILTLTTSTVELTFALERLTRPLGRLGFPSAEFAMMLTIALRFIPVLFLELEKILKAQRARGLRLDSGPLMARLAGFASILVPLFLNSFQRALDLAAAMEVRCYQTGQERGHSRVYGFSARDAAGIVFLMVITTGMGVLGR